MKVFYNKKINKDYLKYHKIQNIILSIKVSFHKEIIPLQTVDNIIH